MQKELTLTLLFAMPAAAHGPDGALLVLADDAPSTIAAARRAVQAAGGFPLLARGAAMTARLPAGARLPGLRLVRSHAEALALAPLLADEGARALARLFAEHVPEPAAGAMDRPVHELSPRWVLRDGLDAPRLPIGARAAWASPNANTLHGATVVHVFYVESRGPASEWDWTPAALAEAQRQVSLALSWWAETAADYGVPASFVQRDHAGAEAHVDFEPARAAQSLESGPTEAGRQVLARLGYDDSFFWSAYAFNEDARAADRTENAFFSVVYYNPFPAPTPRAYAYRGAAAHFVPFRNAFGIEMRFVFAHETGHIYGACDEYGKEGGFGECEAGSCDTCDISSRDDVPNSNCSGCGPLQPPCVMRFNTPRVCWITRAQIGWAWNEPPSPPLELLPPPGAVLEQDEVELAARGATDAESDPLRYRFWLRAVATGEISETVAVAPGADGWARLWPALSPGRWNVAAIADDGKDSGPQSPAITITVRARPPKEPPDDDGAAGDAPEGCGCATRGAAEGLALAWAAARAGRRREPTRP